MVLQINQKRGKIMDITIMEVVVYGGIIGVVLAKGMCVLHKDNTED